MMDRMTVASQTEWSEATPPVGEEVEVWYWFSNSVIEAIWNGREWHAKYGGHVMTNVTHWRRITK